MCFIHKILKSLNFLYLVLEPVLQLPEKPGAFLSTDLVI